MTTSRFVLAAVAASALAGSAFAQSVYLTEDFNGGVMPPTGWVEGNNGNALGWEIELAGLGYLLGSDHAFHNDDTGYNDNYIMSPAMDLTGAGSVYAWCEQGVTFASWRDHHYVDVSLDGGLTFINVLDDLAADGFSYLNADLSAYAGTNGVNVSFHYTGDYASEWELDNLSVDDVGPPPPPPVWPNMPTAFVAADGMFDDFESYLGVVPPHMATNALNGAHGLADPEAYCDIAGSSGLGAFSGTACLEMGLDPLSNNYHDVRNGLIIGLNGAGAYALNMDFQAIDHGEESDTWDGVWVSDDGATWHLAYGDWTALLSSWQAVTAVDLSGAGANTNGDFYMLIAQVDNFPYGYLDGIGIDDLSISDPGPPAPSMAVSGLVAGGTATVSVANCTPLGAVRTGYSPYGGGPTVTPYGDLLLTPPHTEFPTITTDAAGAGSLSATVPAGTTGVTVWLHGMDVGSLTFLNGLMEIIG